MLKSLVNEWRETAAIYGRIMERNSRWVDLYKSGGGNATDFIRADFGTTNPNGLNISSPLIIILNLLWIVKRMLAAMFGAGNMKKFI